MLLTEIEHSRIVYLNKDEFIFLLNLHQSNFRKPKIEKWMINFSLFKQINFKTQTLYKGKVNILLNIKNFVHVSNKETIFSVDHEHIRTCTLSGGCCPESFIGCIFYHHWAWLIWFSYHAKNHYVIMDDRRKQQDILGSF